MKFSHYVRVGAVCSVIGMQTLLSGCSQVVKGGAMHRVDLSAKKILFRLFSN